MIAHIFKEKHLVAGDINSLDLRRTRLCRQAFWDISFPKTTVYTYFNYEGCSLFIATWIIKHKGIVLYLETLVHPFKNYSTLEHIQILSHLYHLWKASA